MSDTTEEMTEDTEARLQELGVDDWNHTAFLLYLSDIVNVSVAGATEDDVKAFEDAYQGEYDSPEDWAAEYAESAGWVDEMPEALRYHIDYESFARDCELGGDVTFVEDVHYRTHVFNNY